MSKAFTIWLPKRRLTRIEILEEMVGYYTANPRGRFRTGGCAYRVPYEPEPRFCAVGRCMRWDEMNRALVDGLTSQADCSIDELAGELECVDDSWAGSWLWRLRDGRKPAELDDLLQPQYRGQPLVFWEQLQAFHDGDQYWVSNAGGDILTPQGHEALETLRGWVVGSEQALYLNEPDL